MADEMADDARPTGVPYRGLQVTVALTTLCPRTAHHGTPRPRRRPANG